MAEHLVTQAHKALFALRNKTKASFGYIPPLLAFKMFDSYILPILEYNNMLWSKTNPIPDIEKVQIGYLKNILGVRKQTPTLAVYAETGRFPLHVRQQVDTVKYWARLSSLPQSDILNKCLKIQESLHARGQSNWYSKVNEIIAKAQIANPESLNPETLTTNIKMHIYREEQSKILSGINDSTANPKLRSYKLFKTTYCVEPYLMINLPKKSYCNIARFRVSSHNLRIETGRHENPKIPVEERICNKCPSNEIEDEMHCLLNCSSHLTHRTKLIAKVCEVVPNFLHLNKLEQFKILLSSKETEVVHGLAEYLNSVFVNVA
jgi:hypothetical protein